MICTELRRRAQAELMTKRLARCRLTRVAAVNPTSAAARHTVGTRQNADRK